MNARQRDPRAVVLHDRVGASAPADAQDTLGQVREISAALTRLGFHAMPVAFSRHLAATVEALTAAKPAVIFNLVEALDGDARRHYTAAALLEIIGMPFSGAGTAGLLASTDKPMCKRLLQAAGIPTPRFATSELEIAGWGDAVVGIVKPAHEDASVGIGPDSLARGGGALGIALRERRARLGGVWFVEHYVDGREFNVALLAGPAGIEVLPIAEIEFVDFPADQPRIVDYAAKWQPDSFAYSHTPRRFPGPARDPVLLAELERLARACHATLDLGSYARVDFRVDASGQPFVLEANANPCLSADAGFMAAAGEAGLDLDAVLSRLLLAAGVTLPPSGPEHGRSVRCVVRATPVTTASPA